MCRWTLQDCWAPREQPRDTSHTFSASCLRLPIRPVCIAQPLCRKSRNHKFVHFEPSHIPNCTLPAPLAQRYPNTVALDRRPALQSRRHQRRRPESAPQETSPTALRITAAPHITPETCMSQSLDLQKSVAGLTPNHPGLFSPSTIQKALQQPRVSRPHPGKLRLRVNLSMPETQDNRANLATTPKEGHQNIFESTQRLSVTS